MLSYTRVFFGLVFLFLTICNCDRAFAIHDPFITHFPNIPQTYLHLIESKYLLPADHPLQDHLKSLFQDPTMFHSVKHLKQAGFQVICGHKQLMVASHPSLPHFLFKKFCDIQSYSKQLKNFIHRIEGAKIIAECIEKHQFKFLTVPQKWLYRLPKRFSKNGFPSYILIVEDMQICQKKENCEQYYHMDREILTELCTVLHEVGGCDAFPRNQPFTISGKIAFVDTEHVGEMKGHFLKHTVPALNKKLQAYAIALWEKLEEQ